MDHIWFRCPRWRNLRIEVRQLAGRRWGDISYVLGGWPEIGKGGILDTWEPGNSYHQYCYRDWAIGKWRKRKRGRERVLFNASSARAWVYGGWCCRITLSPACRSIYSVFGAHSANIFTPWAVPNISLGVNGLLSAKLNSLALCDLACGMKKGEVATVSGRTCNEPSSSPANEEQK